jgi:hypothetical protein
MLRHCGSFTVGANIDADEFKLLWEDMQLFKTERQILILANTQLALHVNEGSLVRLGPADNIMAMMFMLVSSLITTPCKVARLFHVLSTLLMNAMNMVGLLTGPKGITLYVHFVASGPVNAT